jgi:hypothetical protein
VQRAPERRDARATQAEAPHTIGRGLSTEAFAACHADSTFLIRFALPALQSISHSLTCHVNSPAEDVPHIPGSRYAAELNKDARDMRFPPELEHEYHHFYLDERRSHVRSFNVIMCALFVLACANQCGLRPLGVRIFESEYQGLSTGTFRTQ